MIKRIILLCTIIFSCTSYLNAQNTIKFEEGAESPNASIEDLEWIEGHWITEATVGTAEEIWAAPKAGAMMGMFRTERDGEISFYEFFILREVNESLLLQIKHFHRDLKGWEEKDETVDFPLVKLEEKTAWFDGLTMKMIDENHLTVYVRTVNREGKESELVFNYRKAL